MNANIKEEIKTKEISMILKRLKLCREDITFMGIVSYTIYSKEIFNSNKEIDSFLKKVFNKEYKDYVFLARPTIVSKISRFIYYSEPNAIDLYKNKMIDYFEIENNLLDKDKKTLKYKKNSNTNFDIWLKGI